MFSINSILFGNLADIYILDYLIYNYFEEYLYTLLKKNGHEKILFWTNDLFSFDSGSINTFFPKDKKTELKKGPLGSINLYRKKELVLEKDLICFLNILNNKDLAKEKITIVFKDIHKLIAKYDNDSLNEGFEKLLENNKSNIFFAFSEKTKEAVLKIIDKYKLDFLDNIDEKNYIEIKYPNKKDIIDFFNYKRVCEKIFINMELVESKVDNYLIEKKQLSDIISEIGKYNFIL